MSGMIADTFNGTRPAADSPDPAKAFLASVGCSGKFPPFEDADDDPALACATQESAAAWMRRHIARSYIKSVELGVSHEVAAAGAALDIPIEHAQSYVRYMICKPSNMRSRDVALPFGCGKLEISDRVPWAGNVEALYQAFKSRLLSELTDSASAPPGDLGRKLMDMLCDTKPEDIAGADPVELSGRRDPQEPLPVMFFLTRLLGETPEQFEARRSEFITA